jgi:hypothetical protein
MGIALELYEKDFFAWTQEQLNIIKKKAFDKLDIRHLQEELQIMGASEKRELASRLEVLLMHLLKWKYQPDLRCNSWKYTIEEQRDQLKYHLEDNPSLKTPQYFNSMFTRAFKSAVRDAARETGLAKSFFPDSCEWTVKQILNDKFFPG